MWVIAAGLAVNIGHKIYSMIQKRKLYKQLKKQSDKFDSMLLDVKKMIASNEKIKITDYGHLFYINAVTIDIRIIKDIKKITFADGSKVYSGFILSDEEYTEIVSLIKNRK
jgi:effector-binding domain-containing protein